MSKKSAGERKRTVTVVMGPKTAELLAVFNERLRTGSCGVECNVTDWVGSWFTKGVAAYLDSAGIPTPDGWHSHFD